MTRTEHPMNWATMSRAERDAAYNNSAAVSDSPALNARREQQSAAFRAAHPGHLDLAYGTAELPPLVADSRDLSARRSAAHAPGPLIGVPGANHFTVVLELQKLDGALTRQLPLLLG